MRKRTKEFPMSSNGTPRTRMSWKRSLKMQPDLASSRLQGAQKKITKKAMARSKEVLKEYEALKALRKAHSTLTERIPTHSGGFRLHLLKMIEIFTMTGVHEQIDSAGGRLAFSCTRSLGSIEFGGGPPRRCPPTALETWAGHLNFPVLQIDIYTTTYRIFVAHS